MISAPNKPFPVRLGRIVILAMEEILGSEELNAVYKLAHLTDFVDQSPAANLNLTFPLEFVSQLQTAFEAAYGPQAGRGLLLRVGRVCVKYGLREFGSELGFTDLDFRLLPLPTRLKVGSEILASVFNKFTEGQIILEVGKKNISWQINHCPLCWERKSDIPCCALAVGVLQETFYWVSGGKNYPVEEKTCIACGDSTCTIVVDRTPMS